MAIKMVVTDMDGTNHNTYNEKRLEVFLELKNHPIPFVVATGIG